MFPRCRIVLILLTLGLISACGRPPVEGDSAGADSQRLPFDRSSHSAGITPSQSLIPVTSRLPEGTPIPVRLLSTISSVSAHAGDAFTATIDEAVEVEGLTLISRGTPATGRVLEAKPARRSLEPGYLRIVLVSLNLDGKEVMIETSSIFAKGSSREDRSAAARSHDQAARDKDVVLSGDRRLSFRLAQTVDLQ